MTVLAESGDRLIDSIANHLQEKLVGTLGTNLFIHSMPLEVASGMVLINNFGGARVDPSIPGYRKCRFRLIARSNSAKNAIAWIDSAIPHLDDIWRAKIGTVEIKQLIRDNDPVVYPSSLGSNVLEATIAINAVYSLLPQE